MAVQLPEEYLPQPIGAVLVVGGGIAGIQASLDLAESGYYVYLVESSPSIGGAMTQLDKTFPTNDCAMCILAPKLVECGRHLNIKTLTYSDLLEVDGQPGQFRVKVRQRPRYVDPAKCTGCGQCAEVCPVTQPNEFDGGLTQRKAIYRPFPQAYPNIFAIQKETDKRPCSITCPAGIHVQGYVALISQGKDVEALQLIKEKVPFPGILGRICPHPCEDKCKRGLVDEPIAICSLKRFVADQVTEELPAAPVELRKEKVAVVGAGPAGLAAAYYLSRMGYPVTVFEALPVPGGMLAAGIPAYRLPREVLEGEIAAVTRSGVEIKTGKRLDADFSVDDLFGQGYQAVFLAIGAHGSQPLGIPGEDAAGVQPGVEFLRRLNLGEEVAVGRRVAVVGGGNVAMDAARSALRLGAREVTILYRRTRQEMPANQAEIAAALAEGIKIEYLVAPVRVVVEGERATGIELRRMRLGAPDASGRRRPEPITGSEFVLEADTIIPAIGQTIEAPWAAAAGIEVRPNGTIVADPVTLATSRPGVFAGGDAITGPAVAVEAMAAGREAALSIDRHLRGADLRAGRTEAPVEIDYRDVPKNLPTEPRVVAPELPVAERVQGFAEVEQGLTPEQARAEASRCLNCGVCSECLQCVEVCKAGAIDHNQQEEIVGFDVGAVVLCPGFEEFDPQVFYSYGYTRSPNVVSSIEFERILSASGPYQGDLRRPSDQQPPRRIAWLQCVGSRDEQHGCSYCSSVCCTYAIKEAMIAKEHSKLSLETTIFFMDMRTYGKDFDKYYDRGKEEGIRFVRSRVYDVDSDAATGNLHVRYTAEDGTVQTEEFDLVVLSVGLRPTKSSVELAHSLGLQLNRHGFCQTQELDDTVTSLPGIYACGAFAGPKDIPETVVQASAASALAAAQLAPSRHTMVQEKVYPPEIPVAGEDPRIGVFVCHCGINIGGVVNVPAVKEYAATLPHVVFADENLYTCSQDTQEKIKEKIREYQLNRVIVASCSPRTHEPLFQETVREAGLNRYLFEMANIRDQCSWVHMYEPEKATAKAKDLVRMAVAKAARLAPLSQIELGVTPAALVIGGGVTGMTAALNLAQQGVEVHLVEEQDKLGGLASQLYYTLEGTPVQRYVDGLKEKVTHHPAIHVYLNSRVTEASGFVGNFISHISQNGQAYDISHGAAIIATGGRAYAPHEYLYGQDSRVLTSLELEEAIVSGRQDVLRARTGVMIQCVGSRDEAHPYCSRVCCIESIKNALKLKEINPEMDIYILYRDIRSYSFAEEYYRQARQAGVIFIRYEEDALPQVAVHGANGTSELVVTVFDLVLGQEIAISADFLALAVGTEAASGNKDVAQLFKVPLNADNFFLEAHVKLRPVDFATDGVFVAGLAHSPKTLAECISQGEAAAARAATLLFKKQLRAEGIVAQIAPELCSGCRICVPICSYNAISFDAERGVAVVNEALCKGCGTCSAACPSGANTAKGYTDEEVMAQITALFQEAGAVM